MYRYNSSPRWEFVIQRYWRYGWWRVYAPQRGYLAWRTRTRRNMAEGGAPALDEEGELILERRSFRRNTEAARVQKIKDLNQTSVICKASKTCIKLVSPPHDRIRGKPDVMWGESAAKKCQPMIAHPYTEHCSKIKLKLSWIVCKYVICDTAQVCPACCGHHPFKKTKNKKRIYTAAIFHTSSHGINSVLEI